jgi:hypothetical protein
MTLSRSLRTNSTPSQGEKTRVPSIETMRDIGIRIWKMVSWSFIVCPTLRPDRGTYDKEVEGWVLLGIEVRINCLIV